MRACTCTHQIMADAPNKSLGQLLYDGSDANMCAVVACALSRRMDTSPESVFCSTLNQWIRLNAIHNSEEYTLRCDASVNIRAGVGQWNILRHDMMDEAPFRTSKSWIIHALESIVNVVFAQVSPVEEIRRAVGYCQNGSKIAYYMQKPLRGNWNFEIGHGFGKPVAFAMCRASRYSLVKSIVYMCKGYRMVTFGDACTATEEITENNLCILDVIQRCIMNEMFGDLVEEHVVTEHEAVVATQYMAVSLINCISRASFGHRHNALIIEPQFVGLLLATMPPTEAYPDDPPEDVTGVALASQLFPAVLMGP